MNQFDEEKEDDALPIEKILRQFTQEHFSNLKLQEHNNSFMFLEKSSLNLLLAYLVSSKKNETPPLPTPTPTPTPIVNEEFELKAIEKINQLINDNEKEFSTIINLLKEGT